MNKIIFTTLLFTTFLISSCYTQPESSNREIINISYNQKFNGYDVIVIWKPKEIKYDNAIGPAILEFNNGETEFTVTNNYFAVPRDIADIIISENNEIKLNKNNIILDNNIAQENFEFKDINFDGKKELLITKANQGQRFYNSYDAYSFNFGELESDLHQINKQEPFNKIDDFTEFDEENKEIIFYGSGGVCFNSYETYSLKNGKFTLTKIVELERDDEAGKCYKLTYNVDEQSKKLISKEEVEQ